MYENFCVEKPQISCKLASFVPQCKKRSGINKNFNLHILKNYTHITSKKPLRAKSMRWFFVCKKRIKQQPWQYIVAGGYILLKT